MTKNILKMAMMLVAMMLPHMAFAQKQTFALYDEPTGCPDWEPELSVFVAKNPNGMAILACPTATRPFHWPMPRRPCA